MTEWPREKQSKRQLPSTVSLPKWPQKPGMDEGEVKNHQPPRSHGWQTPKVPEP